MLVEGLGADVGHVDVGVGRGAEEEGDPGHPGGLARALAAVEAALPRREALEGVAVHLARQVEEHGLVGGRDGLDGEVVRLLEIENGAGDLDPLDGQVLDRAERLLGRLHGLGRAK